MPRCPVVWGVRSIRIYKVSLFAELIGTAEQEAEGTGLLITPAVVRISLRHRQDTEKVSYS